MSILKSEALWDFQGLWFRDIYFTKTSGIDIVVVGWKSGLFIIMRWIDWVEKNLEEFASGFVHVRLGPGFFRTLHNIVSTHGWPVQSDKIAQCEADNGLGVGDLSADGLPRFVRNLRAASNLSVPAHFGAPTISVTASLFAFQGSAITDGAGRAAQVVGEQEYRLDDSLTSGPKTASEDGSILELGRVIGDRSIIFIGPSRAFPIARAAGCLSENFFCVPSEGAAELYDEAREFVLERARASGDKGTIFLHGASWFGNSLAIDIALACFQGGHSFSSLDLGLSATILDLEFLSTRPWFRKNCESILRTARRLSEQELQPITHSLTGEDVCFFGKCWKQATTVYGHDKDEAIETLERGLVRVSADLNYFQISHAVLALWKTERGQRVCLSRIDKQTIWKAEAALLLAAACLFSGAFDEAHKLIEVAKKVEPRHPYLMELERRLKKKSSVGIADLAPALQRLGRSYLGSTLAWSLWGDYPGSDSHVVRA